VYALRERRRLTLAAGVLLALALVSALLFLFLDTSPDLLFSRRWIYESSTVRATSLLIGSGLAIYAERVRRSRGGAGS